jgi:hypothetical protein
MAPIPRGFGGRRRDGIDPSRILSKAPRAKSGSSSVASRRASPTTASSSSRARARPHRHRLFMSQKTVEANLSRAYRKLRIRSRAELGLRLAEATPPGAPPAAPAPETPG